MEIWIDATRTCFDDISCNFLHLREDYLLEIVVFVAVHFLNVLVQLFIADFVSFLESTVLGHIFLDCIVCQMDFRLEGAHAILGG